MMNFWLKKKCFTAKTREEKATQREREKREKIFFRFCLLHALHLSSQFFSSFVFTTIKAHTD